MFSLSFWASALLTVPLGWSWADTQNGSIVQPSSLVRATIGGSAVLECRSKIDLPPGSVKWFKGTGPNRELIYSDTGSYSRVQKVNNTNRILDILISNITSQDEGVYYCIKFKKNPESELASGDGTRLTIGESSSSSGILIAATAGSVSLILILLVLCCYFKRQKGPSRYLARPEASKKNPSQGEPTRNNEIVYADLQPIGENSQSVSPAERKGLHSEYATIHVQ